MPYYCTVPKCTSMAGKIKNVSFHQFPKDEALAQRWNRILKRGKPYTKYSKVCSLHFTPQDYTMTNVGKNKGQWRTLRKNAIPSQNLPSNPPSTLQDSPSYSSSSSQSVPTMDPQVHQQLAQAIYMHTMLAIKAAELTKTPDEQANNPASVLDNELNTKQKGQDQNAELKEGNLSKEFSILENLLLTQKKNQTTDAADKHKLKENTSFKCKECSRCFKDPDVFVLHKRSHAQKDSDEENIVGHTIAKLKVDMPENNKLRENPILTNLLNSNKDPPCDINLKDVKNLNLTVNKNLLLTSDILSMENQVMAAMTLNLKAYLRNLQSVSNMESGNVSSSSKNVDTFDDATHNSNIDIDGTQNSNSDNDWTQNSNPDNCTQNSNIDNDCTQDINIDKNSDLDNDCTRDINIDQNSDLDNDCTQDINMDHNSDLDNDWCIQNYDFKRDSTQTFSSDIIKPSSSTSV